MSCNVTLTRAEMLTPGIYYRIPVRTHKRTRTSNSNSHTVQKAERNSDNPSPVKRDRGNGAISSLKVDRAKRNQGTSPSKEEPGNPPAPKYRHSPVKHDSARSVPAPPRQYTTCKSSIRINNYVWLLTCVVNVPASTTNVMASIWAPKERRRKNEDARDPHG